jgi:acetyl esterase
MNAYAQPTLDPQLAAAYRLAAEIHELLGPPEPGLQGVRTHAERARQWWNEGGPKMAREREETIDLGHRKLRAVVYAPTASDRPLPAYVYLHGGGFRMGAPRSNDRMLREIASDWGGIVVSLDYVHVPEHVFPVAVEDTAAAYRWLSRNGAEWGIDAGRIAFGGSSAGANIATGAAIQLQGTRPELLRAGVLFVGTFDQDYDTESMHLYGEAAVPNRAGALNTIAQYVPDPAMRQDPRVNCVLADLGRLPPLFVAAAELDVFRDSSRTMAARVRASAGVCELVEYQGMGHLFTGYSRMVDTARRCIGDAAAFLTRHLPAERQV